MPRQRTTRSRARTAAGTFGCRAIRLTLVIALLAIGLQHAFRVCPLVAHAAATPVAADASEGCGHGVPTSPPAGPTTPACCGPTTALVALASQDTAALATSVVDSASTPAPLPARAGAHRAPPLVTAVAGEVRHRSVHPSIRSHLALLVIVV